MYQTLAMLLVVLPFALVPLAAVPVNGMVRAVLLSLRKKAVHGSVTPQTNSANFCEQASGPYLRVPRLPKLFLASERRSRERARDFRWHGSAGYKVCLSMHALATMNRPGNLECRRRDGSRIAAGVHFAPAVAFTGFGAPCVGRPERKGLNMMHTRLKPEIPNLSYNENCTSSQRPVAGVARADVRPP